MATSDPDEMALVKKAITSGVTGCCEWDDCEATRVRGDSALKGLTPDYIRTRLREFVAQGGLENEQNEESNGL